MSKTVASKRKNKLNQRRKVKFTFTTKAGFPERLKMSEESAISSIIFSKQFLSSLACVFTTSPPINKGLRRNFFGICQPFFLITKKEQGTFFYIPCSIREYIFNILT